MISARSNPKRAAMVEDCEVGIGPLAGWFAPGRAPGSPQLRRSPIERPVILSQALGPWALICPRAQPLQLLSEEAEC